MRMTAALVVAEPLARQPRPVEGILSFPDVLPGGAALIVEPHTQSGFTGRLVTMKPKRGNSSSRCHSSWR